MKETELFAPVCALFRGEGFEVTAEVAHCDLVAVRDDELVIAELKISLNLGLLLQGLDRQHLTHRVYLAIPEPKRRNRRFRASCALLERLGLGLVTVYTSPLRTVAAIRLQPSRVVAIDHGRRTALMAELGGRSIQPNVGGSTGVPVYTAYRETAVTIACLLDAGGPKTVAEIKPIAGDKAGSILSRNHYGWFRRVRRGLYDVTDSGRAAIREYPELRRLVMPE